MNTDLNALTYTGGNEPNESGCKKATSDNTNTK